MSIAQLAEPVRVAVPALALAASPATIPPHSSVPKRGTVGTVEGARSVLLVRWGDGEGPVDLPDVPVDEVRLPSGAAPADLDGLRRALASSRVGVRIVIVGSERDAYAVRSCAREAGALDEEIVLRVTEGGPRAVFCAHCRRQSPHRAAIGEVVDCPGCARSLVIYHHFSRTHAAYLGYMVDAEEPR